ncbi:ImmA/IrrE family metallo-endopeptidase [Streptomyces sp. NPDC056161]|uniref:ImmA/IrrE family metallo-endopeptidase n=1 Tax=Streptomyces sp. NPDC056161 TaxID=3345732 RepID=UPI0035DF5405
MCSRKRRKTTSHQPHDDFKQRCEARVRSLGLPKREHLTVPVLCNRLSQLRGRPIQVLGLPLPLGSPDGLLIETEAQDFIIYEARLAPVHQRQVVLHEVGHLICEHTTETAVPLLTELFTPSLDPGLVRRVLGRDHSHTDVEHEAEYIGSLIGRKISTWSSERTRTVPPEARDLVARLSALDPFRPCR